MKDQRAREFISNVRMLSKALSLIAEPKDVEILRSTQFYSVAQMTPTSHTQSFNRQLPSF